MSKRDWQGLCCKELTLPLACFPWSTLVLYLILLELAFLIKSLPILVAVLYFTLINKPQFLSLFALRNEAFIIPTETIFPEMGEVILNVPHPWVFLIQRDFLVMHWMVGGILQCCALSVKSYNTRTWGGSFQVSEWRIEIKEGFSVLFQLKRNSGWLMLHPKRKDTRDPKTGCFLFRRHGIGRVRVKW